MRHSRAQTSEPKLRRQTQVPGQKFDTAFKLEEVQVIDLDSAACRDLQGFISAHPEIRNEDIGID